MIDWRNKETTSLRLNLEYKQRFTGTEDRRKRQETDVSWKIKTGITLTGEKLEGPYIIPI